MKIKQMKTPIELNFEGKLELSCEKSHWTFEGKGFLNIINTWAPPTQVP